MGSFKPEWIQKKKVMVVHDRMGTPVSFLTIAEYHPGCATLDLMRFKSGLPNGLMEYSIATLIQLCRTEGIHLLSLGLSPLAGLEGRDDLNAGERLLESVFRKNMRFYNFRGLYEFKKKFTTRWEPRYVAYPVFSNFPALILSLAKIHGFKLDLTAIRKFIGPWGKGA
jgi:phosphatidylglycerol lysyltransferase